MADLTGQFEEYLTSLDMGEDPVKRGLEVIESVEHLLPEPIERIFVSEYRDGESNRHFESLWMLTKNYVSESPGFVTVNGFDMVPVHRGLVRIETNRESFDFTAATEQSRLTVNITFPPGSSAGLAGTFKASGENCMALVGVLRDYLVPLLQAQ